MVIGGSDLGVRVVLRSFGDLGQLISMDVPNPHLDTPLCFENAESSNDILNIHFPITPLDVLIVLLRNILKLIETINDRGSKWHANSPNIHRLISRLECISIKLMNQTYLCRAWLGTKFLPLSLLTKLVNGPIVAVIPDAYSNTPLDNYSSVPQPVISFLGCSTDKR